MVMLINSGWHIVDSLQRQHKAASKGPSWPKQSWVGGLKSAAEEAGYDSFILNIPDYYKLSEEKPFRFYDEPDYDDYESLEDSALSAFEEEIDSLLAELNDSPVLQDIEPVELDFDADHILSDKELDDLMDDLVDYDYHAHKQSCEQDYEFLNTFFKKVANDDLDALEQMLKTELMTQLDVDFDFEDSAEYTPVDECDYENKQFEYAPKLSNKQFEDWCSRNPFLAKTEYDTEDQKKLKGSKLNVEYYKIVDEYMPRENQTPKEKEIITKYQRGVNPGWYTIDEPVSARYVRFANKNYSAIALGKIARERNQPVRARKIYA